MVIAHSFLAKTQLDAGCGSRAQVPAGVSSRELEEQGGPREDGQRGWGPPATWPSVQAQPRFQKDLEMWVS